MSSVSQTASAKVNLYLHVGPVRRDGFHELASLFVFTDFGDRLEVSPADSLSLTISGPFAQALSGYPLSDNLVMRAAQALREETGVQDGAAIHLKKNLPVAAGIGGGSADAAATLRALARAWGLSLSPSDLERVGFSLGADVPACLRAAPVLVGGAGEELTPAPAIPPFAICLINPRIATLTGPIFKAFDRDFPNPSRPAQIADLAFGGRDQLLEALAGTRNDLQAPAIEQVPEISECLALLQGTTGCRMARMSGSGATVFGLFDDQSAARLASTVAAEHGWWARDGHLIPA